MSRRMEITMGTSRTVSFLFAVILPSGGPKIPSPYLAPSGDLQAHPDLGKMELW